MITRRIGKIIRGHATPFQIVGACVLASLVAFVPGFAQAPGLLAALVALLVVVNANLFLAGLVGLAAKLVALLLTPVSFALGRVLLEGPASGFFAAIVNAPVLAFFGFDYYVVAGGQVLGLVFGLVVGLALAGLTRRTWRKLASLEKDSAAYQRWTAKRSVKIAAFVFVGGTKGKRAYDDLLARRVGLPVRPLGLVAVALLAVLGFLAVRLFDDAIVTAAVRSGLERANGATVDLQSAHVDLAGGGLTLSGLALADPDALETNLFAAESVEAKLSTSDILRKRATIDRVVVSGAVQGGARKAKGQLTAPPPEAPKGPGISLPGVPSLDDVLQNAEVWKERLRTVKRWIDRFSAEGEGADDAGPTWEEQLRERVRLQGYANVRNDALVEKTPTLLIRLIEARGVKAAALPGDVLDITAENVSTQPRLVGQRPVLRVTSSSGSLAGVLQLPNAAGAQPEVDFRLSGLSVDEVAGQLKGDGAPPVEGGTLDITAKGVIGMLDSNLPVVLTLHDTRLRVGGSNPTPITKLDIPVTVRGPIDNPAVQVDKSALQNVLVDAGKDELKRRVGGEFQRRLGGSSGSEAAPAAGDKETAKDAARGALQGFLKKPEAVKPAEAHP